MHIYVQIYILYDANMCTHLNGSRSNHIDDCMLTIILRRLFLQTAKNVPDGSAYQEHEQCVLSKFICMHSTWSCMIHVKCCLMHIEVLHT